MLKRPLTVALVLAATATVAPETAPAKIHKLDDVTVEPSTGSPTKRFRIRFTARNSTKKHRRFYDIETTGGQEFEGCDNETATFIHPPKGKRVTVIEPHRPRTPDWCLGHYKGVIFYEVWDRYGDTVVDKIVGRFSFDVVVPTAGR